MSIRTVSVAADQVELRAAWALPEAGARPLPAVLVLHELFGLNEDIRRVAERFAHDGYAALALDLYSAGPRPRPLCIARLMAALRSGRGAVFEQIEAARRWLAEHPEVDASRVGVAGFCLGGGFALLHAAQAEVGAAAAFYAEVPEAAQALEGICPVFAAYGGRDRVYGQRGERLRRHLDSLGVAHQVIDFPQAGHSFMNQQSGWTAWLAKRGPMRAAYHHDSAERAWSELLAFFATHLPAPEERNDATTGAQG